MAQVDGSSSMKLTLQDVNALFKIKYEKLSENVYNSANVLLGRVKKSYNFTGRKLQISIPQTFAGGVGSGSLPRANAAKYAAAEITAKKLYAVVDIDRETIKASLSSEGAFVQATKEVVKKGVESFMRNMSRILFSDGSGKIATIDATASADPAILSSRGTAEAPKVVLLAGFKEADVEERDLVNIGTGNGSDVSLFEIVAVDISTGIVELKRLVGTQDLSTVTADIDMFMQGSEGNDPIGLKVLSNEAGEAKLHEVDRGRRWNAEVMDASDVNQAASADFSTDKLNEMMLRVKKKCGKSPNLIVTSFKQYQKILDSLESQKQYNVNTRAGLKSKSGADISFSGVEFMSIDGAVGIFPERFVEDDRIYLLNDNHIHIYHRPDFGWFDDDGTVFLRKASSDEYEARYGGYLETYINPCFHGVIHGLSV